MVVFGYNEVHFPSVHVPVISQLNLRQEKALLCMVEEGPGGFKGGMSAEKYIRITDTSRATATRDLQDLVEKGALIQYGELRHTRYYLAFSDPIPAIE
jgi:Fic family protein